MFEWPRQPERPGQLVLVLGAGIESPADVYAAVGSEPAPCAWAWKGLVVVVGTASGELGELVEQGRAFHLRVKIQVCTTLCTRTSGTLCRGLRTDAHSTWGPAEVYVQANAVSFH